MAKCFLAFCRLVDASFLPSQDGGIWCCLVAGVGINQTFLPPYRKGIRLKFLNQDEDMFAATQQNLEKLAGVPGRVLFSF